MTRRIILSLLVMLVSQAVALADGSALLVTLSDGHTDGYVLSEKPRVTFEGDQLVIATADATTTYERSRVSRFTFVDASVITVIDAQQGHQFEYRDNCVRTAGTTIQAYTLGGRLVKSAAGTLSLADQPAGVYLVKTNSQTIKVVVRK